MAKVPLMMGGNPWHGTSPDSPKMVDEEGGTGTGTGDNQDCCDCPPIPECILPSTMVVQFGNSGGSDASGCNCGLVEGTTFILSKGEVQPDPDSFGQSAEYELVDGPVVCEASCGKFQLIGTVSCQQEWVGSEHAFVPHWDVTLAGGLSNYNPGTETDACNHYLGVRLVTISDVPWATRIIHLNGSCGDSDGTLTFG